MNERVPVSKRQRFEVFKRDSFTCQYCGRTPPLVVLEVDHVVAVAKGGSSDDHNLLTSCFDCNRGKADGSLAAVALDTSARSALLAERLEQAAAYEALLAEERQRLNGRINAVIGLYEAAFPGWTLKDSARPSIRNFLQSLPFLVVSDAMELACERMADHERAYRYFCGVCWNKIRGGSR